MTIEKYINKRAENINEARKRNYNRNKGLDGTIATEAGKSCEAYLKGKAEVLEQMRELLGKMGLLQNEINK